MKKAAEILSVIVLSMLIYSCKKENKPPVINNIQFNPTEIITNSVVTLTATATDPEGDNLSYIWNCPKGTFTSTTGQSVNWTAPTDEGTYQITVTVNDGKNTVSQTSNIVVLPAVGSLSVNSMPSGANIFIDGIDTKKVTPSNFSDLSLGIKIISVTKTGYFSNKDTIAANIQYKKTSTVSFILIPKANISGYVYYAGTKIPVSGVTVSINSKTITTGTTGSYSLTEIASGSTILTATKPDYDPFTKSITLNVGDNSLNIEMTSGIYTNTISGTVKTSIGTIIPGVSVYLLNEDGTSTNIHDQTDANGNYQLPAVPQGQRKLSFTISSFNNNQKDIFVSNSSRVFDVTLVAKIITAPNPIIGVCSIGINQIKWGSPYGPELLSFNIYKSSDPQGIYSKLNNLPITLLTNPPSNGLLTYNDPDNTFKSSYYKISVTNVDSYEGPLSSYLQVNPIMSMPFVTTSIVIDQTQTSAILGGNVTNNGGYDITGRGVYYGTSSNPETTGTKIQVGNGLGLFSTIKIGLVPGTKYYVKAYAINNLGTSYANNEIIFTTIPFGTVNDIDNNTYKTIQYGIQIWTVENLKTSKFNDGSSIPLVTDNTEWFTKLAPSFCWYNNDMATYKNQYGGLYNWYTTTSGKLCPLGWHVPSYDDWVALINFLQNNGYAFNGHQGDFQTNWLGKSIASTSGWAYTSIAGRIGNDQASNNSSAFTALAGGYRDAYGTFTGFGETSFWGLSEIGGYQNQLMYANYNDVYFSFDAYETLVNLIGTSVRCIKDN